MLNISPVKRLSIGLVFMTITVVLTAQLLGLLPNEVESELSNRKLLTENLATQLTRYAGNQPMPVIKTLMLSVTSEHDEILSAAIRNRTGLLLIEIGEHKKNWELRTSDLSTTDQIQVPIQSRQGMWGNLELRFEPLASSSIFGLPISNSILLIVFIAVAGSILFGSYLRKALQYLDPSSVIPDRVKNAMDIISEGILILDQKEHIILVNQALSDQIGVPAATLIGKTPDAIKWDRRKPNQRMPWQEAQKENKKINDVSMHFRTEHMGTRTFMVNAAPIAAEDGKVRGTMVTFNDVTQLQKRNKQLNSAVHTLKISQAEVKKKNQELAVLASRDPLTSCLNRRAFFEIAESRLAALQNTNEPVTCIMLDIDHFKAVNDTYGHGVGDIVIKKLAATIISCLRKGDLSCRYGGEEFCIYLDNTNIDKAYLLAERIRKEVESIDFENDPATKDLKITTSFGLSDNRSGETSIEAIIDQADQALYYSKEHGRNRVSIWKEVIPLIEEEKSNVEHINKTGRQVTGRPLFINMLQQTCIDSSKNQEQFAALLIDIDMFKRVNNIIGHHAGDDLLIQIQNRIEKVLDHEKIKALLGKNNQHAEVLNLKGDEYGVILPSLGNPQLINKIAQYIKQNVGRPFDTGTHEINLTCSIGSTIFPDDAENPEVILRNIELAAARAKERGGNYHQAYLEEFNIDSDDDLIIENKLHSAMQNNEIYLHYQPKIDLKSGQITGFEALARWTNPELGDVSPGRFIPIAEQTGLINELGLWVLKTACMESKQWIDNGFDHLRIAVNLSAIQLKKHDFLERVLAIFNETGFDPNNLELEVTENIVMENIETVTPILYQLNEKGVELSIDDFGIGYSSLNYIKRFPIGVIKIDRSFVMNIIDDQDDQSIVSAIIAMAHALNLKVVAEGAETNQQLRLLQQMNCDQLQGFIFSRPIPFNDVINLLHENKKNASLIFIPKSMPHRN